MNEKLLSVNDALTALREGTGELITRPEIYAYIRLGVLNSQRVARTHMIGEGSVSKLVETIKKIKEKTDERK